VRANLATVFFGTVFGFTLGWARLAEPETIHRMLRLMEPDVFLLMGSAIATAAIGARLLRRGQARAWSDSTPVSWRTAMPERHHVMGSVLFGLSWSVVCSCPGPIAVQIGRGDVSGLFVAAGLMVGIALRDATRATPAPSDACAPGVPEAAVIGP
jgi:uncharacterized membrane protein YedE/YeeE